MMSRIPENGNIPSENITSANNNVQEKEDTVISMDDRSIDHPSSVCLEEREASVIIEKAEPVDTPPTPNVRRQKLPACMQESEDNGSRWSIRTLRVGTGKHQYFPVFIT